MLKIYFFTLLVLTSLHALADEPTIIDVRRNITLSDDDIVYKDFYIGAGEGSGLKKNMVVTAVRKLSIRDASGAQAFGEVMIPVGQLRIIAIYNKIAVAREYKLLSRDELPMLEQVGIMTGDKIDLQGSFIDNSKPKYPKRKVSETSETTTVVAISTSVTAPATSTIAATTAPASTSQAAPSLPSTSPTAPALTPPTATNASVNTKTSTPTTAPTTPATAEAPNISTSSAKPAPAASSNTETSSNAKANVTAPATTAPAAPTPATAAATVNPTNPTAPSTSSLTAKGPQPASTSETEEAKAE